MNSKELLALIKKEKLWPYCYCIDGVGRGTTEIVFHIEKNRFYITERDKVVVDETFATQGEACTAFLKAISYDYPQFKKYI